MSCRRDDESLRRTAAAERSEPNRLCFVKIGNPSAATRELVSRLFAADTSAPELSVAPDVAFWLCCRGAVPFSALCGGGAGPVPLPGVAAWFSRAWAGDGNFPRRIAALDWTAQMGFVSRCGLQFGGEMVLYEDHPDEVHSRFLVIFSDSRSPWRQIASASRMAGHVVKELLVLHFDRDFTEQDLTDFCEDRPPCGVASAFSEFLDYLRTRQALKVFTVNRWTCDANLVGRGEAPQS